MNDSKESPKVDLVSSKSNWSIKTKLARGLWMPFRFALRLPSPRFLSPLRVLLLRAFGAQIGKKVLILGGINVWCPWNLKIGDTTAIGFNVEIYNFAEVSIGELTVVSQYSYLCTASHDYRIANMPLFFKPIHIGSQSWIAAGAFISSGVQVGNGSVVGAFSVVTKDVAPWTVVAGNPAQYLKDRTLNDAALN